MATNRGCHSVVVNSGSNLHETSHRAECHCLSRHVLEVLYGGISMTKFNEQESISNYPNCTCINPKLNSNKPILCSKSGMHPTEAEGQKPVSGIMHLVKMEKGILSGKRHNTNRQNAKRHNTYRHNAKRHNAKRHNAKRHHVK